MPQTQGQSGGPNPPIILYAQAHENDGTVTWSLSDTNPPVLGSKHNVSLVKGTGDRDIEIHLVPTAGLNISFNTTDPIWVARGKGKCPPPSGSKDNQIDVLGCTNDLLTIGDKNNGVGCTLTYQLNFIGAPPLDPEIRNGGGHTPKNNLANIAIAIIGTAAVVLVALVVLGKLD